MAQYKDIKKDRVYNQSLLKNKGPRPEIHFYPDITDELIKSDRYDIDWTLSYADCMEKIKSFKDIWTTQMAFANQKTADMYDCFIHFIDPKTDTQRVGLIGFSQYGEVIVKEWV